MTEEAEKLLTELRDEAVKMDAWIKDDDKRRNYREKKERQLSVLQNVIEALKEKQQSIFEQTIRYPHNRDLEQYVLGALLVDANSIEKVLFLSSQHFYFEQHQIIFNCIKSMHADNEVIDIATVAERLKFKAGGPVYLCELTERIASSANIEAHARILIQKSIQRELITVSVEMIKEIQQDTEDVFDTVQNLMKAVKNFNVGKPKINQ